MALWIERLEGLLADNRAALDKALTSHHPEDWQTVLQTGKAIRDFFAAYNGSGVESGSRSFPMNDGNPQATAGVCAVVKGSYGT